MSDSRTEGARQGPVVVAEYSGLVWVTGTDAVSFLDSLLSQNIVAMEPGTVAESLLLGPNGKLRATLHVLRGEGRVGLICDSTATETVAADLKRFKIRVDVEITIASDPVWEVWGEQPPELPPAPSRGSWIETSDGISARISFRYSELPRYVVTGKPPVGEPVDSDESETIRIELGQARMGLELDDKTIPQEGVDVAASVDFAKGCYLGQELVARIDSRGHVNRRLCGVLVEGDEPVPAAAEIQYGDKIVGVLPSSRWSAAVGQVVGLALVRVEVTDQSAVIVHGRNAKVVDLPILA